MLHFCVICGVRISRTSAAPGAVPAEDVEWYQQLRVSSLVSRTRTYPIMAND